MRIFLIALTLALGVKACTVAVNAIPDPAAAIALTDAKIAHAAR